MGISANRKSFAFVRVQQLERFLLVYGPKQGSSDGEKYCAQRWGICTDAGSTVRTGVHPSKLVRLCLVPRDESWGLRDDGESTDETSERERQRIIDKPAVVTKPILETAVSEDSRSDRG